MEWIKLSFIAAIDAVIDSSSDSETNESEEELAIDVIVTEIRETQEKPRCQNYIENVIPLLPDDLFKAHFRVKKCTFDAILTLLENDLRKQSNWRGRNPLPPEKQLYIALWTMATPDSYRSVCDRFNVGNATAWRSVHRVVRALNNKLHCIIKWPTQEEAQATSEGVEEKYGFPGVIGAVDGTHIKIIAPKQNPEGYKNRKGVYSLQLQVVCDKTLKFLHVYAGEAGSVHDMRVFRLSGLQRYCTEQHFYNNSHLLADGAYTIQKHIMVPYINNGHLTEQQKRYNYIHASSRSMVERSLGLLKGRFRSLLDILPMKRTDLIAQYIIACCILHNICIMFNDMVDVPIIVNNVVQELPFERDVMVDEFMKQEGCAKRDNIKNGFT